MLNALIHRFEGTLIQVIRKASNAKKLDSSQLKSYPSFATLLTEKTRQSIGAIQGHMPAETPCQTVVVFIIEGEVKKQSHLN